MKIYIIITAIFASSLAAQAKYYTCQTSDKSSISYDAKKFSIGAEPTFIGTINGAQVRLSESSGELQLNISDSKLGEISIISTSGKVSYLKTKRNAAEGVSDGFIFCEL
ncbi:MAG: hypothetical protein WA160_11775 [Pseudobdellovibrio sp.]